MGAKVFHYQALYGTIVALPFMADNPLTSGTRQTNIAGATGPVTADITVSKDGAAFGASTGAITNPGAGALYLLTTSAADMQGQRIIFRISDVAGAAYDDVTIVVETQLHTSRLLCDPRPLGGNVSGVDSYGQGAGHGFSGTAGATGKICNFFDTVLGSEAATGLNLLTATIGTMIQKTAARFYKRVVTNATQQVVYKQDGTSAADTMTITPSGSSVDKGASS